MHSFNRMKYLITHSLKYKTMKNQFIKIAMGIFISSIVISSCKKDPIVDQNEEEVITTMQLTFVPTKGGTTLVYKFDDPDGPGGGTPAQDDIVLAPSSIYNVTLQLLNKTENPFADITTEIQDESDAHRFYYEPSTGSNITISGLDNDSTGVPLGIKSTWTTSSVSTGKMKITLRHYPNTPSGKATDDLVNSSKSATDIEVEFNTKIQ